MKKVLIVDDSALMRRMYCDIIQEDGRFQVEDKVGNGKEALALLRHKTYDVVVLDINMPVMTGLELLQALQLEKISVKIMVASTDTKEGAQTTLDALELGALDFIHKPDNVRECRMDGFKKRFCSILDAVANSKYVITYQSEKDKEKEKDRQDFLRLVEKHSGVLKGNKLVAIACSTGGPKALQDVIPKIPANINAPILVVQHMPPTFTKSLAQRLDQLSAVTVKEAEEGEEIKKGCVYISRGGSHMNVLTRDSKMMIHYTDEPPREGVKPCANYMYESLCTSRCDTIVCVVLTGMGADATKGITSLKEKKKLQVIAQEASTCAVYGMPKSIVNAGLADQVVPLKDIAQEIILNVGVR